jgi:hypothetical protein
MKNLINTILILGIAILGFFQMKQCNSSSEAEEELARLRRNSFAMNDSIRIIKSENGRMVAEKSSLELKVSELSDEQKDLINRLAYESSKDPEIIIQTEIVYRDTGIKAKSTANRTSDSSGNFEIAYKPTLPGKNKFSISGKVPYKVHAVKDSSGISATVTSDGDASLAVEQTLDVVAGLSTDPVTKMLMVRLSTDFPGVTFAGINGIKIVDNAESRRAMKDARKNFGIGFNLGYGLGFTTNGYNLGPYLGIGIHYSPKILQF